MSGGFGVYARNLGAKALPVDEPKRSAKWFEEQRASGKFPARHGYPWSPQEVAQMNSMLRNHYSIEQIAAELKRLPSAIQCRIEKEKDVNVVIIEDQQPENFRMLHLITLLQEGYTTCKAKFAVGGKDYTYKLPLDMGVNVGDHVVVEVNGEYKVVLISTIHPEPEIDIRAPYALKWVVSKVDTTRYQDQMAREQQALEHLQKQERATAKKRAIEQLMGLVDAEELKKILTGA